MQLKDTNLHYLLKQVGLTYNEAEIYLYLLQVGTRFGANIHPDLKMDKSSCYRALNNLTEKNLIYAVGEERNRQFTANPPDHVEALVRLEEKKLLQTKKSLNEFQTLIKRYTKERYQDKNITIITNEAGHRQYMEARLKCESKLIRELGGRTTAATYVPDYDEYMTDYISRRVKEGIFLRQLTPYGEIDDKWEKTSQELNKEARELPKNFSADASFSVWDSSIYLASKEKGEQIGVMINDQLIANLMNSMFNYIWDSLPKSEV